MAEIRKILIANRGEIAVRIIKTCRKMGIVSGVVYAEDDAGSLAVKSADISISLGSGTLSDTYLNIDKIIAIAIENGFDAIHPGYGFLSENATFAKTCKKAEIIFIGPEAAVIEAMGDKIKSKQLAQKAGAPILQPITGTLEYLFEKAKEYEYPVLIKAAAGGGGKGMRVVNDPSKLKDALTATSREAKSYFGDERVFIEKYVQNPRHIEVQVLADNEGNAITLFERECTLQRRHQKVIEEAPSPTLTPEKRKEILEAALKIVKASVYTNAGTIEFLVDHKLNLYFLEMNTRIQVEHPVTEMITGIDLVEEQIRIAAGEPLRHKQEELEIKGHTIECRIYAEDPENNFFPSPGKIHFYKAPDGEGIRIDAALDGPGEISDGYDPMIAKLVAHGRNRQEAIERMTTALQEYYIHGIKTNVEFQQSLIRHKAYVENNLSTHFIEDHLPELLSGAGHSDDNDLILVAFALFHNRQAYSPKNVWEEIGFWHVHPQVTFLVDGRKREVMLQFRNEKTLSIRSADRALDIQLTKGEKNVVELQTGDLVHVGVVSQNVVGNYFISFGGKKHEVDREDNLKTRPKVKQLLRSTHRHNGELTSPMPGKILEINIRAGDTVVKDQKLLVLEAMKMENQVVAPFDGKVAKINVRVGDRVDAGEKLIELKGESSKVKEARS